MREIKFRVYDKSVQRMFEVVEIDFSNREVVVFNPTSVIGEDSYIFDNTELMQYTGLKDKNGVEIYEGDIVTTSALMITDKTLTVTVYEKGGSFLLSGSNTHVNLINVASGSIQVIGNIYENKVLLEVGE